MNAAQRLWFSLGLPHALAKHANGGPVNAGLGPSHKGWALHKLAQRNRRRGTYRTALGFYGRPCNGSQP